MRGSWRSSTDFRRPPGRQRDLRAGARASRCGSIAATRSSCFTREQDPNRAEYDVRTEQRDGLRIVWVNNTFRNTRTFEETYRNEAIGAIASRVIDDFKPDVAHIHHLTCLSTTIVRSLAERRIPCFVTLHDYWLICHRGQLLDVDYRVCDGPGCGRTAWMPRLSRSGRRRRSARFRSGPRTCARSNGGCPRRRRVTCVALPSAVAAMTSSADEAGASGAQTRLEHMRRGLRRRHAFSCAVAIHARSVRSVRRRAGADHRVGDTASTTPPFTSNPDADPLRRTPCGSGFSAA